jgi:WD40 repeat protein
LKSAADIGRELGQPPEWFDRLRNEAIAALALPDLHITHSWPGFPPGTFVAEVSDDFQLYARTTRSGACSVRRVADDVEVAALPEVGEPVWVDFGPGRLIVLFGDSSKRVQLWDVAGPEPVRRCEVADCDRRWHWDFRARDWLMAVSHRDGSVDIYATDTGRLQDHLEARGIARGARPRLHPTAPVVTVCSYYSPLLQVRELGTGAALLSLKLPWEGTADCAWSPGGRMLAVSDGNEGLIHLYAFDPAAPSLCLRRVLHAPENSGGTLTFNPGGDRLATRGWGNKVHLFDVDTGRSLFSTHALIATAGEAVRFGPTGRRLGAARVGPHQDQIGLWSVADAREYRALVHDGPVRPTSDPPDRWWPAVHPGGRLAAWGFPDGVAFFDLESGREVEVMKIPSRDARACFDGAGNLLTNTYAGFFRWPVRPDPAQSGGLIVGPAERLPFHPGNRQIRACHDGRVIAQAMFNGYGMERYCGGWVLHPNAPEPRRVEAGVGNNWTSVSPDGRWVVFGQPPYGIKVYDSATCERVWQSPQDKHYHCCFSPDSQLLVTDNNGRAYAVGTWEPGRHLGPGIPWDVSPDSRFVVLGQEDGVYRLVELATGRELARLEDPDQHAGAALFSPDGTRLVVATKDGLRVWDLRRIGAELANLGLDWELPLYPSVSPEQSIPPVTVGVDYTNFMVLTKPR